MIGPNYPGEGGETEFQEMVDFVEPDEVLSD